MRRTHSVERHQPPAIERLHADSDLPGAGVEDEIGLLRTSVEDGQPLVLGEAVVASLEELHTSTEEVAAQSLLALAELVLRIGGGEVFPGRVEGGYEGSTIEIGSVRRRLSRLLVGLRRRSGGFG